MRAVPTEELNLRGFEARRKEYFLAVVFVGERVVGDAGVALQSYSSPRYACYRAP